MKRTAQRVVWSVVTVLLLGLLGVVVLDYATRPVLVAGPMLQSVGPDGFSVVWWTVRGGDAVLEVDLPGGGVSVFSGKAAGDGGRMVATAANLRRGASPPAYRIRQRSRAGVPRTVASGVGRLASQSDERLRFLVFGDSGSGKTVQYELGEAMPGFEPDLVIHTGDVVYPSGEWLDYGTKFFSPYAALLRDVPFYPCLGNHDMKTDAGKPLLSAFHLPDNGPAGLPRGANYWFDCGPARFVCVDTNASVEVLGGPVAPWLERALATTPGAWRFAFFHHPPYTGGNNHPPDERVQSTLVPVLEKAGADVVFCGHNHLYERTRAIRGGRVVPDGQGVFYVISGAGGGGLYREKPDHPDYIAAFDDQMHGFTVVEIAGETLRIRHINRSGTTVDDWTYTRGAGGRAATTSTTSPSPASSQTRPTHVPNTEGS